MATQAVRGEIVGRDRELEALRAFLSDAGGSSILVLRGEVGAGKTTLWLAGAELAEGKKWLVLRSRPAEAEATLALAGIADLLDGVLDGVLPALPEPQRRALAAALLLEPGEAPGERAVAAAFLNALRALSEQTPVLVAVDDLQWLDPTSTGVLLYALRRIGDGRIRALLAHRARPGDDPASKLRTAFSPTAVDELPVGPLSLGAIHALLRSGLDYSPPARSCAASTTRRAATRSSRSSWGERSGSAAAGSTRARRSPSRTTSPGSWDSGSSTSRKKPGMRSSLRRHFRDRPSSSSPSARRCWSPRSQRT